MSRTEEFDLGIRLVTEERGAVYGHPLDDFRRIAAFKEILSACPHPEVRHALEMIANKMSRLCSTPSHSDSILDIAGYARNIAMLLDEEKRRNEG